MKEKFIALNTIILLFISMQGSAQYAYGDHWYSNPLGFKPLDLHGSMGFIVPAVAVGAIMLTTKRGSFLHKRLSVYNETGLGWGYKYPYTFMPQNNTGINFMLRKYMAVGIEFDVLLPRDDFNKTAGFAVRPFARFYPVNKDKWRMYFESGGGFIYLLDNFPLPTDQDNRLGTYWNGITKYGLGAEIDFNRSNAIMFGVRHLHISNGDSKGVERNPSHDSNGFFVGLSRKL
jgi:hypothetical protein